MIDGDIGVSTYCYDLTQPYTVDKLFYILMLEKVEQ